MPVNEQIDARRFREAIGLLLNRDLRPDGEHIDTDNPYLALATKFVLFNRELFREKLARGWTP